MALAIPDGLNTALIHDAAVAIIGATAAGQRVLTRFKALGIPALVVAPAATLRLVRCDEASDDNRRRVLEGYDAMPAGSFGVVQVVGDVGGAVLGDVVAHRLKQRGVYGVIIDGPARDVGGVLHHGPPVWSAVITIAGMASRQIAAESGVALVIDGAVVRPGDVIAADRDGAIVIAPDQLVPILAMATRLRDTEQALHERLARGTSLVDALMGPDVHGNQSSPSSDRR